MIKKKIKKIVAIATILIVAIVLLNIFLKKEEQTFFKNNHFLNWELNYPSSREIIKFKSKRSFGNDFADYIIFPFDENLKKEIEMYIIKNRKNLISEGDEIFAPSSSIKIFNTFSENSSLEKRIESYNKYKYWVLEKNDGFDKLGILMSEREVIFLFIRL